MVNVFIANTDNAWFDFLAAQYDVSEVNFWKPSGGNFNAISEGELLAFRLKSPRNKIGGFGVFYTSSVLPIQVAWDAFGTRNGVASLDEMLKSIAQYREDERVTVSTFIGCRILVEPVFFPKPLWLDLPELWASNIVGGKRFSTDNTEGRALWETLEDRASKSIPVMQLGLSESQARYGEPTLIVPRLGQGAFRVAVTENYERQCALTGGKVLPALDAAHIRPYGEGGSHAASNGILLRKDIHSVFDAGYATIDENLTFIVSDKVREIFHNGNEYRRLHGTRMRLPKRAQDRPLVEALKWHNVNRFMG